MTFGGAPCPSLWGVISETITDMANSILHNPFWDRNKRFDKSSDSIDPPEPLPDNIPFHPAKDLVVHLPDNLGGYVDVYIDDNIGVAPDFGTNVPRLNRVIPLMIHTFARPTDSHDIIPRKDIISMKKFRAEGRLEEIKTVLGWVLNTRSLRLSLPPEKLRDWSRDINSMISSKKAYFKLLELMIGWINHVACILHRMRHYMGHIYQAL